MTVYIELQNTIDSEYLPSEAAHQLWIETALQAAKEEQPDLNINEAEITVRLVSAEESQQLNRDYRQKDKPTNVLSFPFETPEMIPSEELDNYLGDLVVCEAVLIKEADIQNKSYQGHYTHLIIHGVLHLLGFDHTEEEQAIEMESIEITVLQQFGIANPYTNDES